MAFKEEFAKALQSESESVYGSFLKFSKKALPQDAQQRYEYLRSPNGRFIARDQADVDVYVSKVAEKHIPKFKWLYETLFEEHKNVFSKDLDLVVWGCGCGLDLLAFYDCAMREKNPQLWATIRYVTLVDISGAALLRAKEVAEVLFPMAVIKTVECNLQNLDEVKKKVRLRQLNGYLPRVHLISNLLDLLEDASEFAKAVKWLAGRRYNDDFYYYNEYIVAFSPEYKCGKVLENIQKFQRHWTGVQNTGSIIAKGNGLENCEYAIFSYSTLAGDVCYKSFLRGKNLVLKGLVAECSEVISDFDLHGIIKALARLKVCGENFYKRFHWVYLHKYQGKIERIIFVGNPINGVSLKPIVVDFSKDIQGKDSEKSIEKVQKRALKNLVDNLGNDFNIINGQSADFVVFKYQNAGLALCENENSNNDQFWKVENGVDYSLYFRIEPGDIEPLPDLNGMDEKQKEIIFSRKQYRKIRGGAGCGKSTTMMWHALMAIIRTHQPVLLVCKTVTLFSRNARRMAATLLRDIPGLQDVNVKWFQFKTLDKVLCDHISERRGCLWKMCAKCKCEGCKRDPIVDCRDFRRCEDRYGRKLSDEKKKKCCQVCMQRNIEELSRKGTSAARNAKAYGAVLIDEVQSADPDLVQAVVNLTYEGNPACECYVFCDERQSLRKDAVEVDLEKQKLRVKVPNRGVGYGRWIDLNKPYRSSNDFTGRLVDVAIRLQSLNVTKYGDVELVKMNVDRQMELTGYVFSIRRSSGNLISETFNEIELMKFNGVQTITIICDNVEDVRELLRSEQTKDWKTTHTKHEDHKQEQELRKSFKEMMGCIHLTTVTLAQGWDLENVIFICTTENDGKKNTLENVLTGATRAKNSMRILDRTGSGWLYNELKDLSQL